MINAKKGNAMINAKKGYTYDDLLLVPKCSEILSRSYIDLSVDLGKGVKLQAPIVSANMKNVTEVKMATAIADFGGLPILHRFADIEYQIKMFKEAIENSMDGQIGCSVGVGKDDYKNVNKLFDSGCSILCVDVAHGDHRLCTDMTEYIAGTYPNVLLIAGNVATAGGANRLYNAGADVIKVGVGGGCFAAGTRVLMSNGTYKNIEDIKIGDRVINKNGEPKTVLNSFSTGIREVVKLRHSTFYKPTYVTPDHRFWVGDLNTSSKKTLQNKGYVRLLKQQSKTKPKASKLKWKQVQELQQDCLLAPRHIKFELADSFSIPLTITYSKDITLTPTYELGYIFGAFLGDGHASCAKYKKSKIGSILWYFTNTDKTDEINIAKKLKSFIKKEFNKDLTIKSKNSTWTCALYYKPLADFFKKWGTKNNKHLPSELLVNNKQYLKGILDGLIESDGHIEKHGRKSLVNTSISIIEIFNIITYLVTGIFPNNSKPTGRLKGCQLKNCKPSFSSRIIPTGNKRLLDNYQVSKLLEYEITCLSVPVYDLTIDCDTHSFVANNVIVHNSLCSTRIETGNGVPQMTALADVFYKSCEIMIDPETGATNSPWNMEYRDKNKRKFKIIADGGIRRAGDIVKSLCFSDAVMLGSLLAGTDETPGQAFINPDKNMLCKMYAGSSTHKANRVEGVIKRVPYKGPVKPILNKLMEGVQSGLSYQGCENLTELKEDPEFVEITSAGLIESHPHTY